jgi:hypothetical protein
VEGSEDMLRCPYRKMTTAYEHEGLIQGEETFAECHKDTCPLYVKGMCVRVQKEINDVYFIMKEDGKIER